MIRKWLAVGVVFLFVGTCIIPATAIENESSSQIPSKASKMLSCVNEIYPQIHLTKSHLPMLAKAIASLNNTFYKTILQQIRWSLERKNSLDEEELRMMTNTMGITNISFYCGYMTARGEIGYVTIFPFTFFALCLYNIKHIYIGPILIGMWFTN